MLGFILFSPTYELEKFSTRPNSRIDELLPFGYVNTTPQTQPAVNVT
jgi:hypothetical protein